ncbi:tetratricopeptide repeat protein [Xanthomonas maliensis]|uniref:tetratricopeptide repeat protein n=1 Tax=Xanthomonas maliensis TaxID=1321368 RepID=UPI0003A51A9E|nr:tetratricopeptide repeat protein [Xanthomonas maliensis]KAB7769638.1 hypothetical protein CKY51_05685 [Xanthomonas maliensis]
MKVIKGMAAARPVLALVLLSALAGCASAPKKAPPPSFDATMARAESQVGTVGADTAIKTFEDAARADPTKKEPWVRIAQLQFDRNNYARAIVAAEEVLQRDPDDIVADGVMTVAGFRIANQSLQRLQGRGALASDTARKEAETLAATLRATMGDAILAPEKPKKPVKRPTTRRGAAAPASSAAPAGTTTPRSSSDDAGSDPFKNLGGN